MRKAYVCDQKQCPNCSAKDDLCYHTENIKHAKYKEHGRWIVWGPSHLGGFAFMEEIRR